jgi:uncharacterized membrane protein (DUF485 family)
MSTTYYLRLKQRNLLSQMTQVVRGLDRTLRAGGVGRSVEGSGNGNASVLGGGLHKVHRPSLYRRVVRINHRYCNLVKETHDYNRIISRCLNSLFVCYILVICYMTYLLFISKTSLDFRFVYVNVYAAHIFLLSSLIVSCSAVSKGNAEFGRLMSHFYSRSARLQLFGGKESIKVRAVVSIKELNRIIESPSSSNH